MYKSAKKTPYDSIVTNKENAFHRAEKKQQSKHRMIIEKDVLHEEGDPFDNINYGVRVYLGIENTMFPDNVDMTLPNNIKSIKLKI